MVIRDRTNSALKQTGTGTICISIVNSRSTDEGTETDTRDTDGSGLGSRLIQSFVSQLDGTLETSMTDDRYELHVTFPLSWPRLLYTSPSPRDPTRSRIPSSP